MTAENWVAIIVAIIGSGLVTKIVDRTTGVQGALRELMFDRIDTIGTQCISDGKIDRRKYESLIRMHEIYHNKLHGNGYLDDVMDRVKKLEIVN